MAKLFSRALVALLFTLPAFLYAAPRVVTLSPANTELAFAAGITPVGVSSYSNYPPAAKNIEEVSTWQGMNLERIVALKPDLVVAWRGGNAERQVNQLTSLGIKVIWVDAVTIEQVADALRQLAAWSPKPEQAKQAAQTVRLITVVVSHDVLLPWPPTNRPSPSPTRVRGRRGDAARLPARP